MKQRLPFLNLRVVLLALVTTSLSGCINTSKPVLSSTPEDVKFEAGNYWECSAIGKIEVLVRSTDCREVTISKLRRGELLRTEVGNSKEAPNPLALRRIEGNLFLVQLGKTTDSSVNLYGYALDNGRTWYVFFPESNFDPKLEAAVRKFSWVKTKESSALRIAESTLKDPSIKNLSAVMKLISKDSTVSYIFMVSLTKM